MTKKKHPHRHTGKIIPLRTKEQAENDFRKAVGNFGGLEYWFEKAEAIKDLELSLVQNQGDIEVFKDRVSQVGEALSYLDWVQSKIAIDENTDSKHLDQDDLTRIAHNSILAGWLLGLSACRSRMEESAVIGEDSTRRGKNMARESAGNAFEISRDELLSITRDVYACHRQENGKPLSQKDLAKAVSKKLPVGHERVRKLWQEHKILKKDYSQES